MLEKYRKTMSGEVLHSWASDAQNRIEELEEIIDNLKEAMADVWAEAYKQGVEDERTSEANIGIAGFGAKVNPARQNPYAACASDA